MEESAYKYLKYGKYLDDVNWQNEINYYITNLKQLKKANDIACEQIGVNYYSPTILKKKEYLLNKATTDELIMVAKDYYQWIIADKLSKSSPHLKKLFNLVFFPRKIHPYTFFYEDEMFYDYDYINEICEDIDKTVIKMINKI